MAHTGALKLDSYNAVDRQNGIRVKLEASFARIRTGWINRQGQAAAWTENRNETDTPLTGISNISDQVTALTAEIQNYRGPHINQLYRTLNERCTQFQIKLDRIGIEGRDDLKQKRRAVLMAADAAAKELSAKIHPGGSCQDCEVKLF